MGDITRNFSKSEFECKCGCEMPDGVRENIQDLAEELQTLRDYIGSPISINSAYRCLKHNRRIGSNNHSQHTKGKAADIRVNDFSPDEVVGVVEDMLKNPTLPSLSIGGIGRYNTFTHLDIRDGSARWDKR